MLWFKDREIANYHYQKQTQIMIKKVQSKDKVHKSLPIDPQIKMLFKIKSLK